MPIEELLLILPAIGSVIGTIISSIKARRAARASQISADKSEKALVKDIEDEITRLESEDGQPDANVIVSVINELAKSPNKDAQDAADSATQATKWNTRSIVFSTIFGVLLFIATPVSNAIFGKEPLPCVDAIQQTIEIAKTSPEAWVPLADDDRYNEDCHINAVFAKATGQN